MRRLLFASFLLALALALWAMPRPLHAQGGWSMPPKMDEAWSALRAEKYVRARTLAEELLKANPDGFEGWFILGIVYVDGDGNLPRAQYCLSRARTIMEKQWRLPGHDGPWNTHAILLLYLARVAQRMDDYEGQVRCLQEHDLHYLPHRNAQYGWPLMKLGRIDEARERLNMAVASDNLDERIMATNTLAAIEFELDNYEKAHQITLDLLEQIRTNGWNEHGPVLYCNAGEHAIGLGRFDEAERHLLEGTRHFDRHEAGSPWQSLALLYAQSGRLPEAVSAVRKMHEWSHACDPALAQQRWNEEQRTTAVVLLAAGYEEAALAVMDRIVDRPDRRGYTSTQIDQSEISLTVIYSEVLDRYRQHLREKASWCGFKDWLLLLAESRAVETRLWMASSRAASLLVSHDRLSWGLRPYAPNNEVPEWMQHRLVDILGAGVAQVELERLLARAGPRGPRERPYLLLMKGEAELERGSREAALVSLREAYRGLPEIQVMMRARALALTGRALEENGDSQGAATQYRMVLDRDPTLLRALDIALPVTVEADADVASQEAARLLRKSPRFRAGDAFSVTVRGEGGTLAAALQSREGTVFARASVPVGTDPVAAARALCQEFHRLAFAPRIDLSQTDINSLDGSNATGEAARKRVLDLFSSP